MEGPHKVKDIGVPVLQENGPIFHNNKDIYRNKIRTTDDNHCIIINDGSSSGGGGCVGQSENSAAQLRTNKLMRQVCIQSAPLSSNSTDNRGDPVVVYVQSGGDKIRNKQQQQEDESISSSVRSNWHTQRDMKATDNSHVDVGYNSSKPAQLNLSLPMLNEVILDSSNVQAEQMGGCREAALSTHSSKSLQFVPNEQQGLKAITSLPVVNDTANKQQQSHSLAIAVNTPVSGQSNENKRLLSSPNNRGYFTMVSRDNSVSSSSCASQLSSPISRPALGAGAGGGEGGELVKDDIINSEHSNVTFDIDTYHEYPSVYYNNYNTFQDNNLPVTKIIPPTKSSPTSIKPNLPLSSSSSNTNNSNEYMCKRNNVGSFSVGSLGKLVPDSLPCVIERFDKSPYHSRRQSGVLDGVARSATSSVLPEAAQSFPSLVLVQSGTDLNKRPADQSGLSIAKTNIKPILQRSKTSIRNDSTETLSSVPLALGHEQSTACPSYITNSSPYKSDYVLQKSSAESLHERHLADILNRKSDPRSSSIHNITFKKNSLSGLVRMANAGSSSSLQRKAKPTFNRNISDNGLPNYIGHRKCSLKIPLNRDSSIPQGLLLHRPSLVFRHSFSRRPSITPSLRKLQMRFAREGRDFESVYTNHKYTKSEREILASHDSFDYLPSHSVVYKEWLQRQPARLDWDRWLMMALIGITIGIVGFLLHQAVHLIGHLKWHKANEFLHQSDLLLTWAWVMGYSLLFVALSAASVVFICLPAGGSGIPEVIGFLNGTVMRHVLNLRAFVIKFFSCVCAVGGGLPVGPEGPMIHMGSIVGTGLSQFRSRTLGISLPFFQRFRNSEDRRNFTAAGAAAGVASAFTAPVGGLLFGMEEVSSFWSMKLGWMIFFCCMLASFTTDIFNSSFNSFTYRGIFGLFVTDKYILFKLGNAIPVNVIMFVPAMVLGCLGGIFGAIFTITNLKIARLRRRILTRLRKPCLQKLFRFMEPLIIMAIWATITVFLPAAFPCKPMVCPAATTANVTAHSQTDHLSINDNYASPQKNLTHTLDNNNQGEKSHGNTNDYPQNSYANDASSTGKGHHHFNNESLVFCPEKVSDWFIDKEVHQYTCQVPKYNDNGTLLWGEYNEVASLLNVQGQDALRMLFSRHSHYQFSYPSLLTVLALYFFMTCWASSSAVACGIVVPMLFIGGLYGRVIGKIIVDLHGGVPTHRFWKWIDPGALALIGAASFFGGVSRLTMSLTVIMIEITNDVAFLLPIMIAIMFAKWVGDYITHPIYHSLLEIKCIPYLDSEPIVYDNQNNLLNLELYKARNVMHSPVITITIRESVAHMAHLLLETTHGGFPVVKYHDDSRMEVAYGLLTRTELCVILCDQNIQTQKQGGITITPEIPYEEVSIDRIPSCINLLEILEKYVETPHFKEVYIDLEPYVNRSASRIDENFSLHRTYIVFRTLGLRHLMVVDSANRVVGIITRKDLMGFNLEERLVNRKLRGYSIEGGITKLLPSEYDDIKEV